MMTIMELLCKGCLLLLYVHSIYFLVRCDVHSGLSMISINNDNNDDANEDDEADNNDLGSPVVDDRI